MTIKHFFRTSLLVLLVSAAVFPQARSKTSNSGKGSTVIADTQNYQEAMGWFRKAEALIGTAKENGEEQAELFRKAISIRPGFLEAHYNLGLIYSNQNKTREAAAEFETVLKLEPKFDPGIFYLLANAYREIGNFEGAITALETGLGRKPKDLNMLRALAYLQFHQNKDSEAAGTLQQILASDATDVASRIDLALWYQKKGEMENAIIHYQEALKLDPENFVAHFNLGLIFFRQKKTTEAVAELGLADKIQPGNAELLERLGDAYSVQRKFAEAIAAYKAALEKSGNSYALLQKLGFSLANTRQIPEAISALEQAVKLNSQNSDTYFILGDLYSDYDRIEDAITAYKKSLELNPKQKEVLLNVGTLYAEKSMLQEAMVELKKAIELDPDYAGAWANIALVAEKLNSDKEAINAHEKLATLGKAEAVNYFHLGILYAKNNQPDLSITAFAKAIEREPEKYRAILKEELKNVHSVLDSIRFQKNFTRLLAP
jgi:tetratricopeptide (TPR) repeat protein